MKPAGLVPLALGAAIACAIGVWGALAEEQGKGPCSRLGQTRVTGQGFAYDAPGGSRIGGLAPGAQYFLAQTLRYGDGELWLLLIGPRGAHVGWVRSKEVSTSGRFVCNFGLELLYANPNR